MDRPTRSTRKQINYAEVDADKEFLEALQEEDDDVLAEILAKDVLQDNTDDNDSEEFDEKDVILWGTEFWWWRLSPTTRRNFLLRTNARTIEIKMIIVIGTIKIISNQ